MDPREERENTTRDMGKMDRSRVFLVGVAYVGVGGGQGGRTPPPEGPKTTPPLVDSLV